MPDQRLISFGKELVQRVRFYILAYYRELEEAKLASNITVEKLLGQSLSIFELESQQKNKIKRKDMPTPDQTRQKIV